MEYFSINIMIIETKDVKQISGCLPTLQNTNTCISCNSRDSCNEHTHTQMHIHTHAPACPHPSIFRKPCNEFHTGMKTTIEVTHVPTVVAV